MERTAYNTRAWRDLPRDYCVAELLLGDAAGPCRGLIHHHHVNPLDPDSRTVQCCQGHHSRLHTLLRSLNRSPRVKRCPHQHKTRAGREACERRLNRF